MDTTQTNNEKLKEETKQLIAAVKERWLNNLFYFNRECLLVEQGKDKVHLNEFHREMCNFVDERPDKQKLILVPRGHLKSSLVTIGKVLQWIAKDPSTRILIANATYQMAVTFLNVIKRHLTQNPEFIAMFGKLAEGAEKWSENAITLSQAKVIGGNKESTVFCYGMGGNLVSQHFDHIILDDIVNEDTVNTKEQIEKTIQFYRLCQPLLEKGGELVVIGTVWRDDDLYSWIRDKENGVIQDFNVFLRQAITDDLWDNSKQEFVKGKVLWPEKYDLNELSKIRRKMGSYTFASQYQNLSIPPSDATFKREWFRYYEQADLRGVDLNRYLLIDPAISQEAYADYTAMVTVGVDQHSNIYVLDILRERMDPNKIINNIFFQYERWHPQAVGLEEVAFQRSLRYSLKQEMEKRKRYLNIVELSPHTRTKDQRIKGLQPLYANGKVLHNKDLVYNIYLEDELLRFPNGKHDDEIDSLSYCLDLISPPKVRVDTYRRHKYLYGG